VYGVPENSQISVRVLDVDLWTVHVKWAEEVHAFAFSESDTVGELRSAVHLMRGADTRRFVLFDELRELSPTDRLLPLKDREIEAVDIFTFCCEAESVLLPIRSNATLADAQSLLSSHLGLPPHEIEFIAGTPVVADLSRLVWDFGDSMQFGRVKHEQAFSFEGRIRHLAVDFDVAISALCPLLCTEFDLDGETRLTLVTPDRPDLKGSEADPDMTLADLGLERGEVVTVMRPPSSSPSSSSSPTTATAAATATRAAPSAPAAPAFQITLLLGVVPRVGLFALPPTATLTEAEAALKQRWKLEDLELEFALFDLDTDEMTVVPKGTTIGTIDHGRYSLSVRPAQFGPAAPDVVPMDIEIAADVYAEAPDEDRLQQSMKMTIGTVNRDLPAYEFVCDSPKSEFRQHFPLGTKVAVARSAVGSRFGRSVEEVSLFFMGKALKDGFVIDRLRLGGSKITVYLTDLDPVILGTVKRRPPR
jgi:hypothetical protein